MFRKIWYWFLKKLYRRLVLQVVVLNSEGRAYYESIDSFCKIEVPTAKGVFVFNFKEDRRRVDRGEGDVLPLVNYVIKLEPPEGLSGGNLRDKMVMVIKVFLLKLNRRVLVEVLTDIYLDSLLEEDQGEIEV